MSPAESPALVRMLAGIAAPLGPLALGQWLLNCQAFPSASARFIASVPVAVRCLFVGCGLALLTRCIGAPHC